MQKHVNKEKKYNYIDWICGWYNFIHKYVNWQVVFTPGTGIARFFGALGKWSQRQFVTEIINLRMYWNSIYWAKQFKMCWTW